MKKQLTLSLIAGLVLVGFVSVFFVAAPNGFFGLKPSDEMLDLKPGDDYAEDWARVDSLQNKGLSQSALDLVNKIYDKAKAANNDAQRVKAVMHIMKFTGEIEEEALVKNIGRLEGELVGAGYPLKPMLHSLLAEHYYRYFSYNSWQFMNRTETVNLVEADPRTWSLHKIIDTAAEHYRASLEPKDSLQRTRVEVYDAILIKETDSRLYRPTLYDLLAHRALEFYADDVTNLPKPAYAFVLDQSAAFAEDAVFAATSFDSKDTLANVRQSLLLYQELTRMHAKDEKAEARIMLALERLMYVRGKSVHPEKDELYEKALTRLQERYKGEREGTMVSYYLAEYWSTQGDKYNALTGDAHKWDKKKALELCDAAISAFKDYSMGAQNCKYLKEQILMPSLAVNSEVANLPNMATLLSVQYRNVDTVYYRVVSVPKDLRRKLEVMDYSDRTKALREQKVVQSWNVALPKDADYNVHTIQAAVPGLANGYYAVLASTSNNFAQSSGILAFKFLSVTELAYVQRTDGNEQGHEYVVTHRQTGKALEGVKAQLFTREYDYNVSRYVYRSGKTYTTDANGMFRVPAPNSGSESYMIEFNWKGQEYQTDDNWYQYRYWQEQGRTVRKTVFFTDRAIYRPGQTIYFKGILMESDGGVHRLLTNTATTVTFYDVNSQRVASLDLRSNEYGSVQGTFRAPQGMLNGQMRIEDGHGSAYFSVEDYKRPKFEVVMDPVKGSFRLGQQVKVSGKAMAYAGSSIDGAEVKYRVVRTATFPYCYWPWWRPRPQSPQVEIKQGTTLTDASGGFEVEFEAIPDKSLSAELKPEFHYQVIVDVVDITGETHSVTGSVRVGHVALDVSVQLAEFLNIGTDYYAVVGTRNLNGQFEAAKGQVKVSRLKMPETFRKASSLPVPDKMGMDEATFRKLFPDHALPGEENMETWAKALEVMNVAFDTEKEDSVALGKLKSWMPGAYVLELETKDAFGTAVTVKRYFHVYEAPSKTPPLNSGLAFIGQKMRVEPGEDAQFVLSTALDEANVLYAIEHKGKIVKQEWLKLSKGTHLMRIPIKEEHRGNLSVHLMTVFRNRVQTISETVTVPWSNKELKLEWSTFRDKLWPGQKEEWLLKISGPKGEQVAAEMVAGMYDASLDAFRANGWGLSVNPTYYTKFRWNTGEVFALRDAEIHAPFNNHSFYPDYPSYDQVNWFGYSLYGYYYRYGAYDYEMAEESYDEGASDDFGEAEKKPAPAPRAEQLKKESKMMADAPAMSTIATGGTPAELGDMTTESRNVGGGGDGKDTEEVQVRTNLNETAFFYPQLRTNEKGEVAISFTIPEALTRWRFMALAHTTDLKTGYTEKSVVTQKELMVMPNPPRFFRENDKISFSAKLSNLAETDLIGNATLELFDAITMKPIDNELGNTAGSKPFTVKRGQSSVLFWDLKIPAGIQAVTYRVKAKAGSFSDGEEAALPVLSNTMLVTESLPLPVRPKQTKKFTLDKLVNNKSTTLRNHKLTLEFTSNPAWYAIQALPYMMEYPYECAEQTFSRYYANSIASHVANSHPRIKQVFDAWGNQKEALLSNLDKNQELKALLLEETPWVLNAQNEAERKRRVGLLFDLNRMGEELDRALTKLQKSQVSNGAWPWFPGMPESRYITQHIVCGMGHLDRLGVKTVREDSKTFSMLRSAVGYLDDQIRKDYEDLKKWSSDLDKQHIYYDQIQYLYGRSFFKDIPVEKRNEEAIAYYFGQAKKYWLNFDKYAQGMISLAMHRAGESKLATGIIASLKERALRSEEMGMYWKDSQWGLFWYQAPIETQALLIEAFAEVTKDMESVEEMKIWLLKQKQTQDWKTTKATAEACYALLLNGTNLLAESELATITVGGTVIDPLSLPDTKVEAGTGYFKTSWMGGDIKPEMGKVEVKNNNAVAAWGALYWQYFEQLDKITFAETNLKLEKALFLKTNTETGPKLDPIKSGQVLKPGDLVTVRILLVTDRDMEYVHMKDMRAAGFEPVNVISRYKWQDGIGYYESTRDAATNFFMDRLRKGKYVFEYDLRATHQGDFSNGITTIQCMYAPEFTSHSQGIRVQVRK